MQLQLYQLSETGGGASVVHDIERRQHVQQLSHRVLAGCRQASQPFSWLRACGLREIAGALSAGLEDGAALSSVLEATYSQVLEVILSALDRDLIAPPSATAAAAAADAAAWACPLAAGSGAPWEPGPGRAGSGGGQQQGEQDVAALLAAVGRCPAGHAPAAASCEELREAFRVLQALCLLHPKSRALLGSAHYLQLITARACEAPACLPAAMHTLLALLQGHEEAQALFVTTGGLDMLLTRTLQHAAAAGAAAQGVPGGAQLAQRELLLQLLLFLQLLLSWVISEAVKRGTHPSTQRAALVLASRHLGADAAALLTRGLSQAGAGGGADEDQEAELHRRAEAAAALVLARLAPTAT